MTYTIQLENITDTRPLAVVRRLATAQQLSSVIPAACGTVWNVIRSQQIKGAGRHVAVYLDGLINLEVGVELQAPFAGCGEVVGSAIPVGRVASTMHFGPYHQLNLAHKAVADWCGSHGHKLAGPNWEIYGHWVDAWNSDPSKIRTDVYYLLG